MRNIITAIVIDKDKDTHDYSQVRTYGTGENSFDLVIVSDTSNIGEVLYENRGFDSIIMIGEDYDCSYLSNLPFSIRKKWCILDHFDPSYVASTIVSTLLYNIGRENEDKMFSIFTCSYKTKESDALQLYNSLLKQTNHNWNWWIWNDSPDVHCPFKDIKDIRIHVIDNQCQHGNIGFNKHMIASMCDGDYLVEVDHDDELTPDCLEYLDKAFKTYPDAVFTFSYCFEEIDGDTVWYDEGYALGVGTYGHQEVNGKMYYIPTTPDVTSLSMRHIIASPNHVRCWEKKFYHKIGGHNIELSVLDDLDIMIRTIMNGKICKVPKVLYIQHEGVSDGNNRGTTTQSARMKEIWRLGRFLKEKYDREIHEFCVRENIDDPYWVEEGDASYSDIWHGPRGDMTPINYTLEI